MSGDVAGSSLEKKIKEYVEANPGCTKTELRRAKARNETADILDGASVALEGRSEIRIIETEGQHSTTRFFPKGTLGSHGSEGSRPVNQNHENHECHQNHEDPWERLGRLYDWRNEHGVTFEEREGRVWVSQQYEHLLTDELRSIIEERQESLRDFVPKTEPQSEEYADMLQEFQDDMKERQSFTAEEFLASLPKS